jgi:hypothetical protein
VRYKVNFGHDRNGRERNRYYPSLAEAQAACHRVFLRTRIVLAIEQIAHRRPSR